MWTRGVGGGSAVCGLGVLGLVYCVWTRGVGGGSGVCVD